MGYIAIAKILLPLYYRLGLTSIYTYLEHRFGLCSHKTGAVFFFISKIIGAAARLYLVVLILQRIVLAGWNIPFWATALAVVLLIWLYSHRSGMRTIVRTRCLADGFHDRGPAAYPGTAHDANASRRARGGRYGTREWARTCIRL